MLLRCSNHKEARRVMNYIEDTSIMSKHKGSQKITESLLLAPPYDNDVSKKDNRIITEALFEFLCSVRRTIKPFVLST